jgi:hypothetical protein
VAIRDEFRRAWRIIKQVGTPNATAEGLLDALEDRAPNTEFEALMELLHGKQDDDVEAKVEAP